MLIKDLMNTNVQTADSNTHISEIAQMMKDNDCGSVIITKDDRLVGMLTDRDITLRCTAKSMNAAKTKAENVMTPKILYCMENDKPEDVIKNMAKNKVRRLPVLNSQKRLVGIVSLSDLVSNSNNYELGGKAMAEICHAA